MFIQKYHIKFLKENPEKEINDFINKGEITQLFNENKIPKNKLSCRYNNDRAITFYILIK